MKSTTRIWRQCRLGSRKELSCCMAIENLSQGTHTLNPWRVMYQAKSRADKTKEQMSTPQESYLQKFLSRLKPKIKSKISNLTLELRNRNLVWLLLVYNHQELWNNKSWAALPSWNQMPRKKSKKLREALTQVSSTLNTKLALRLFPDLHRNQKIWILVKRDRKIEKMATSHSEMMKRSDHIWSKIIILTL